MVLLYMSRTTTKGFSGGYFDRVWRAAALQLREFRHHPQQVWRISAGCQQKRPAEARRGQADAGGWQDCRQAGPAPRVRGAGRGL